MDYAPFRATTERRPGRRASTLALPARPGAVSCVILLVLLWMATGCAPVNPAPAQAQAETGTVLYSESFDNPPSGWGTWSRGGATVDYLGGGLRILVAESQLDFWSVAGQKFTDASISVDAIKMNGPDDNDFGIICRYQNKDNFYMLVVSSDGYYGIAKMKDGQHSLINADQLQYSDVIARGLAVNHLRADCVGSNLVLYANDQKLIETQDADFPSGDVGVIAGAYDTQGVEILFDNFVVSAP